MISKHPLATLGLGLLAGLILAHALPLAAPSALAQSGAHKWEYFCFNKSGSMDELNKDANTTGKNGWEMVSASSAGNSTLMCFKRPAP